MTVTAKQIIDQVSTDIDDYYNEEFDRPQILAEINQVRREHISSVNTPYTRQHDEILQEDKQVYEYPADIVRMTHGYIHLWGKKKEVKDENLSGDSEPNLSDDVAIYRERVS